MLCRNCGKELRQGVRFCGNCGVPVPEAPGAARSMTGTPRERAVSNPPTDPMIGRTLLGQYQIKDRIGGGGMGTAYLADQIGMDRLAVVKVLHPHLLGDALWVERFNREAKVASKLSHPNSITLYNYGRTEEGYAFIAMEFVDGLGLSNIIETDAPMDPERAVGITVQICGALQQAHELGIVHRDLKADNILLTRRGKKEVAKVLDFGIAKMQEADPTEPQLTATGMVFGTPAYMSPEQFAGGELDGRSDLYSLGIMFYEMLCGRRPFNANSPIAYFRLHQEAAPPPLKVMNPNVNVPHALEMAALKALEKEPHRRYQDADEMARALRAALEAPPSAVDSLGNDSDDGLSGLARDNQVAAWLDRFDAPGGARSVSESGLPVTGFASLLEQLEDAPPSPVPNRGRRLSAPPRSSGVPRGSGGPSGALGAEEMAAASAVVASDTLSSLPGFPPAPGATGRTSSGGWAQRAPVPSERAFGEAHEVPLIIDQPPEGGASPASESPAAAQARLLDAPVRENTRPPAFVTLGDEEAETAARAAVEAGGTVVDDLPVASERAWGVGGPGAVVEDPLERSGAQLSQRLPMGFSSASLPALGEGGRPRPSPGPSTNPRMAAMGGGPSPSPASRGSLPSVPPVTGRRASLPGAASAGRPARPPIRPPRPSAAPHSAARRSSAPASSASEGERRSRLPLILLFLVLLAAAGAVALYYLQPPWFPWPGAAPATPRPTPSRAARPAQPGVGSLKDDMIEIPGGSYQLGHPEVPGSSPRTVHLDPFRVDRREVSNGAYRRCVDAKVCKQPAFWRDQRFNGGTLPVVGVSLAEAEAFCVWRGRRLPTAAEWERAARGPAGTIWPWGDTFDPARVNAAGPEDGAGLTAPSDSFPAGASPEGLLHMVGNVAEWVAPEADDEGGGRGRGRQRSAEPVARVRGGSFISEPRSLSPALPGEVLAPETRRFTVGFRCADDAPAAEAPAP